MNKADLTRWSWVEIDRGALRRNTRAYKNLLDPRQRLCCVVKADAYGHGAVECAKIMYSAGADMFAVATVSEGIELRQGGITKPILILSEPPIEARSIRPILLLRMVNVPSRRARWASIILPSRRV